MKARWSLKDQARFLKRLGELLDRGYPLSEGVESLSIYLDKTKKQEIARSLSELMEGFPLHTVLANLHFDRELVNYVYFAEQHGGLSHAIITGSTLILKRDEDIGRMAKIISYPAILAAITGVLFFFVDRILLPKFSSLFNSMDLEPNLFTKILYFLGDFLPLILFFLLTSLLLLLLYYFAFFKRKSPLQQKNRLVRIPVIGSLLRLFYTHSFTIQLSYLFSGGMSILESLSLFEKNRREPFSSQLGKEIRKELLSGKAFETILGKFQFFEDELPKIVKHGQENGKLGQELEFYSKHCLTQLEEQTERILKILQPVLYSLIGLLVVVLYLAILLPMFRLMDGL